MNCTEACDMNEDNEPLFVRCEFYGKLCSLVSCRLGFSTRTQCNLMGHID